LLARLIKSDTLAKLMGANLRVSQKSRWKLFEVFTTLIVFSVTQTVTSQAAGATLYSGPLELLVDMPFEVGCFRVLDPSVVSTLTASASLTPASCIVTCLSAGATNRFAGNHSWGLFTCPNLLSDSAAQCNLERKNCVQNVLVCCRQDTQHNDTQHNNIQLNNKKIQYLIYWDQYSCWVLNAECHN